LVFYNHQAYKEQFESPLDYDSISEVCGWYSSSVTIPEDPEDPYPEPPPDPEDPCQETVMDRYNTSYKPGTQPFDSDKCCDAPPKMGADCMVMKVGTVQSKEMTPEAKAYYESLGNYCYAGLCTPVSAVEFRAVGPAPGETCGDILNETVVQQRNCCADVNPLAWNSGASDRELRPNSTLYEHVTVGAGPYTWSVTKQGVTFSNGGQQIVTDANVVSLHTETTCGSANVTVTDQCSSVSFTISSSSLNFEISPPLITLSPGGSSSVSLINAVGTVTITSVPPTLNITINGSTLTISAAPSFCGKGNIILVDSCGKFGEVTVLSTVGQWIEIYPEDRCSIPSDIIEQTLITPVHCAYGFDGIFEIRTSDGRKYQIKQLIAWSMTGPCGEPNYPSSLYPCFAGNLITTHKTLIDALEGHCPGFVSYCGTTYDVTDDPSYHYPRFMSQTLNGAWEWSC
jgi:hypothetical protein